MIPIPTDETLMAYADGELNPAVAVAIERAMVRDPMIAIRTVEFIKSRRLTRAKFAAEPLPSASAALLEALVGQAPAEIPKKAARSWFQGPSSRLLAACIVLGISGWAGYSLVGTHADDGFAALGRPQFGRALNDVASGETVSVAGGRLRAIATVALKDSRLCRQIEFTDTSGVTGAVVCRGATRDWQPVLALSVSGQSGDYRPASGNQIMDRFFNEEGGGRALEGPEEKRALAAG